MKYLKSINEAILPKELRYKNLLFHATSFENLISILKENFLYGFTKKTLNSLDFVMNLFLIIK